MTARPALPLYHTNPLVTTVAGFIQEQALTDQRGRAGTQGAGGNPLTPDELLDYAAAGQTNRERVRATYNAREAARIPAGSEAALLKPGTLLLIPPWAFENGFVAAHAGTAVVPTGDVDQQYAAYLGRYAQLAPIRAYQPGARSQNVRDVVRWRVWAHCKALGGATTDASATGYNGLTGRLVDLSPLVMGISTRSNTNGTNISLILSPATARPGEPLLDALRRVSPPDGRLVAGAAPTAARSFIDDGTQHHRPLLGLLLQANDLLFIALDPRPAPFYLEPNPQLLATDAAGAPTRWDILALVDNTSISHGADGTTVGVSMMARDYMKLLLEDGDFFYPLGYAGTGTSDPQANARAQLGGQGDPELQDITRRLDSSFLTLGLFINRPIENVLATVFGQLSHVRYAPDVLFAPWGEARSTYLRGTTPQNARQQLGSGIWQIIKLQVDATARDRRVCDTGLSAYQGSLLNLVQQVCQPPFVEFYGETLANQYYFIARRPPFSERDIREALAITDALPDYNLTLAHIKAISLDFDTDQSYAWFQVTPRESVLAEATGLQASYFLPPVFFPELAALWGAARQLFVPSNLLPFIPGGPEAANTGTMLDQSTQDLRWLIATHVALPFTRRGQITIRHDPRIKRGTWIRLLPTREVFYIDGIEHQARDGLDGIEMHTTLYVTRGMVDRDDAGKPTLARYFRLVDFGEGTNNYLLRGADVGEQTTSTSQLHLHYAAGRAAPFLPDPSLAQGHRPSGYGLAAQPITDDPLTAAATDNALSLADVIERLRDPDTTLVLASADGDDFALNTRRVAWLRDYLAQQVGGATGGPTDALAAARVRERITASPIASQPGGTGQTFTLQWRAKRPVASATGQQPRLAWKIDRATLRYFLQRRQFA